MMFPAEKCTGQSGSGTQEETEKFAGDGDCERKECVSSDELASAVTAVSDEIGDILKDELGDAARAECIGAELADLSAELGLLAGLAAQEPKHESPAFLDHTSGHRSSGSGSSTSSSSTSAGRPRRPARPIRPPRRKPINKGKEISRRLGRRAVSLRVRCEPASEVSDVGADSDSADEWTELDTGSGTSDSSSGKEGAEACAVYEHKEAEAPPMGQSLLPLLSTDVGTGSPEHFLIRHEDILQLLASAEENVCEDVPEDDDDITDDNASASDVFSVDSPVTPEQEAALLNYICEAEGLAGDESQPANFQPIEEWLLGVYHSWCDISTLMYTMIGTTMSAEIDSEEWLYRARFPCHCRLCLGLCESERAVARLTVRALSALAHDEECVRDAVRLMRALSSRRYAVWLQRTHISAQGADIINSVLVETSTESELSAQIVDKVCLCRPCAGGAVDRFLLIMHNFINVSTINFKVEMLCPDGTRSARLDAASRRLARFLAPYQRARTRDRLRDMRAHSTPCEVRAWSDHVHRCECLTPKTLCASQRKELLRVSFFSMMQVVNELNDSKSEDPPDGEVSIITVIETMDDEPEQGEEAGGGGQQSAAPDGNLQLLGDAIALPSGDGTDMQQCAEAAQGNASGACEMGQGDAARSAEGPEAAATAPKCEHWHGGLTLERVRELNKQNGTIELEEEGSDATGDSNSLGLSTSSSLDSASELLLVAAAAVESGEESGEPAPGELCRSVRHLMRSIASIERLMDRVLRHCDEWRSHPQRNHVDEGLSEVDRKLMAMYRRLPEVHRRQLQVYRKQKKLSTVCMQLVGGRAPAPPLPGSPPPASPPHVDCRALCPEYHLQRFKEVRRKVMHMRDQQLYYHRLRMWLEEQLRQERESAPTASNATILENILRRKRASSPKPRLAASKRKHRPFTRPHKILQMLQYKSSTFMDVDGAKQEADPPEAFPLDNNEISDADTIVGEKEEMSKEMKECLAKFVNFDISAPEAETHLNLPESVSPPLQETSPTTTEPMPVYTPKPSQSLVLLNKLLTRSNPDKFNGEKMDFQAQTSPPEVLNITPLNARRTPMLVEEVNETLELKLSESNLTLDQQLLEAEKDPNFYKYVSFGLEVKKAMEECQNIINSYNSIKDRSDGEKNDEQDCPLSLEQFCEVVMSLDKSPSEILEKIHAADPSNNKLGGLVESMPEILANMPEIASRLSEFAQTSELPEFESIMNNLPDINNEAQLTPETLKQIRELKLNKTRDSVKVTKNTTKRKNVRKIKNNTEANDAEAAALGFDCKDISDLLKDEKELHALMKSETNNKEDFKDLLFSVSAQVVINKVFEYLKNNKNPELAKCLDKEKDLLMLSRNTINSEMFSKASALFDNSVKDARSMDELRELVKSRLNYWKHYVTTKFKSIPIELLETEIDAMLDKFYRDIKELAGKQCVSESDKIIEKIDEMRYKNSEKESDVEGCPLSKESLKKISKLLRTSAGNSFDLIIMKLSKMSKEKQASVKSLKLEYIDVLRRCTESPQLANWILQDPDTATNVIVETTGLPPKKTALQLDVSTNDKKIQYFLQRVREMNAQYMETLPKDALTGDEWLVILYRLDELGSKLTTCLFNVNAPKPSQSQGPVSATHEAEILAGKGLSKIISIANAKAKKAVAPKNKKAEIPSQNKEINNPKSDADPELIADKKCKNEAVLAKCEAILTSKGEKTLLDSFYTIKSYINQGLPIPETYKKHVISICSSIDPKLLDEVIEDTLSKKTQELAEMKNPHTDEDSGNSSSAGKEQNPSAMIGSPELLAKYSAQALRKAKQTLNAVAFRKNLMRNGQTKSESDACDTPKTDCKWTSDCTCETCKGSEMAGTVCLGDIVKQCYDMDAKPKTVLDERKKEKGKPASKPQAKAQPKACDNTSHQPHVCKVGHSTGKSSCVSDAAVDQPCTCCYCTVFGHAPPITPPVSRNFNETRERLRSILNKKKLKCKAAANGEAEAAKPVPTAVPAPVLEPVVTVPPTAQAPRKGANVVTNPPQANAATAQPAGGCPTDAVDPQKLLSEKMARMVVSEPPEALKAKTLQRSVPVQVNLPNVTAETKNLTLEQVRVQQKIRQHQQAILLQIQQQQQQQQNQPQCQKPEPIYETPTTKQAPKPHQNAAPGQPVGGVPAPQAGQQPARSRHRHSLSSRDTSVVSTSSGCSGGSCWRGGHAEDPRDLDALLQYIEGPARHVDRGKKRAKKQRQKNKRLESRLLEEREALNAELMALRYAAAAVRGAHAQAKRRVEEARARLKLAQPPKGKKGKKNKVNPVQQAKAQEVAELLGELTTLMNFNAKELHVAETHVAECTRRLHQVEAQLRSINADNSDEPVRRQPQQQQPQQPQQQSQEQSQQQQQQMQQMQSIQQQLLQQQLKILEDRQINAALINADGGMVRLRRVDPSTVSTEERMKAIPVTQISEASTPRRPSATPEAEGGRKQTWEQALAHMTQLAAQQPSKDKKKAKEPPSNPESQRSMSLTDAPELSKKQRKRLAKQQAEEEEARLKQQEAKAKKAEPSKKKESKKEAAPAAAAGRKDDKSQPKKQDKNEKAIKGTKQDKNAQAAASGGKPAEPSPLQANRAPTPAASKKERKKMKQLQQAQKPDTNVEHRASSGADCEKAASCSIMEQLSCGVQVADLRLPPGITLTRVPPTDKKDQVNIKSVPIWKGSQLAAAPTPVARPPPVIAADPAAMMFMAAPAAPPPEPPNAVATPEVGSPTAGKSKKAKKKAKKAAEANQPSAADKKPETTKMVTLRNPMFHPNLPPVQISSAQPQQQTQQPQQQQQPKKQESIRIPDPIPMPPNACQATITPMSNGMYTIRNPLMSMMHQQTLMGARGPGGPQVNPAYPPAKYNYVNPNQFAAAPPTPHQAYVLDPRRTSPKSAGDLKPEFPNTRIMNLVSFTQKNDEGYSLFKTNDEQQQRCFLEPDYYLERNYANPSPKPTLSPNPIGTRPGNESNRLFDSGETSLFANNPIQRPEPIGTPLKLREEERGEFSGGLYTPFGHEERDVFRSALFDKGDAGAAARAADHVANGDSLPYFQRLRVGSKLNNEVTIHHVMESKFYKGQDAVAQPSLEASSKPNDWMYASTSTADDRMYTATSMADDRIYTATNMADGRVYGGNNWAQGGYGASYGGESHRPGGGGVGAMGEAAARSAASPRSQDAEDSGFGAVGSRAPRHALEFPGTVEAMQRFKQMLAHKQRLHHLDTN